MRKIEFALVRNDKSKRIVAAREWMGAWTNAEIAESMSFFSDLMPRYQAICNVFTEAGKLVANGWNIKNYKVIY